VSKLSNIFLALLMLASCSRNALAGPNSYQCKINEVYSLQEEGVLSKQEKYMLDQRFSIDRNSGIVIGPEKGFPWSFSNSTVQVLSRGSTENNFVVIIHSPAAKNGVHLTSIRIQEFASGVFKPFLATSGLTAYVGSCE